MNDTPHGDNRRIRCGRYVNKRPGKDQLERRPHLCARSSPAYPKTYIFPKSLIQNGQLTLSTEIRALY